VYFEGLCNLWKVHRLLANKKRSNSPRYLFPADGSRIAKLDPSHPALRGFELQYRWESVQEEDFGLGVQVMFCACLAAFLAMFTVVICGSDLMDLTTQSSSTGSGKMKKTRLR
jgi:hypothetical protein